MMENDLTLILKGLKSDPLRQISELSSHCLQIIFRLYAYLLVDQVRMIADFLLCY